MKCNNACPQFTMKLADWKSEQMDYEIIEDEIASGWSQLNYVSMSTATQKILTLGFRSFRCYLLFLCLRRFYWILVRHDIIGI